MKQEGLPRILISLNRDQFRQQINVFIDWYNEHRATHDARGLHAKRTLLWPKTGQPATTLYSLKKRVNAQQQLGGNDSGFIELPQGLNAVLECVIEGEDSGGTWRVHLKGYSATDIAVVGRGLRGSD